MKASLHGSGINRRVFVSSLAVLPIPALLRSRAAIAQDAGGQLASWNDGPAYNARCRRI
jgi:hypothetical protein